MTLAIRPCCGARPEMLTNGVRTLRAFACQRETADRYSSAVVMIGGVRSAAFSRAADSELIVGFGVSARVGVGMTSRAPIRAGLCCVAGRVFAARGSPLCVHGYLNRRSAGINNFIRSSTASCFGVGVGALTA